MYCKEGMVAEARAIFDSMIDSGQVPNIITYSALIDGYCLLAQMGYFQMCVLIMYSLRPKLFATFALLQRPRREWGPLP